LTCAVTIAIAQAVIGLDIQSHGSTRTTANTLTPQFTVRFNVVVADNVPEVPVIVIV